MIRYGLYSTEIHDIAETPALETILNIISEIPEDEISSHRVYEINEGEQDQLSYDALVALSIPLNEWLKALA